MIPCIPRGTPPRKTPGDISPAGDILASVISPDRRGHPRAASGMFPAVRGYNTREDIPEVFRGRVPGNWAAL